MPSASPPLSSGHDAYQHIAFAYDFMAGTFLDAPHRRMALLCQKFGARRVLDMGCGTGLLTSRLCASVPCVVGMDISRFMLRKAQKKQSEARPFALVLGNGCSPPFPVNSFDAVTFSLVLHESGSGAEPLLEAAFSLAPLIVILEWRSPERNLDYPLTAWPHIIERLAGKKHYQGFRQYLRQGGLYGLAHRIGAKVEEAEPLKFGSLVLAVLSRQ